MGQAKKKRCSSNPTPIHLRGLEDPNEITDPGQTAMGGLYTAWRGRGRPAPRRKPYRDLYYEIHFGSVRKAVLASNKQAMADHDVFYLLQRWISYGMQNHALNGHVRDQTSIYRRLREISEPVRTALRDKYGSHIDLYRSQQKGSFDNKRYALSFSTRRTAELWYRDGHVDFFHIKVPIDKVLFVFGENFVLDGAIGDYDEIIVEADVLEGAVPITRRVGSASTNPEYPEYATPRGDVTARIRIKQSPLSSAPDVPRGKVGCIQDQTDGWIFVDFGEPYGTVACDESELVGGPYED